MDFLIRMFVCLFIIKIEQRHDLSVKSHVFLTTIQVSHQGNMYPLGGASRATIARIFQCFHNWKQPEVHL